MLEGLIKILLLPITVIASLFSPGNTTESAIVLTPTPAIQNVIVAKGSITEQNVTVDLNVTIPKDGGAMSGTISGICDGTIQGTYDGKENGAISGTIQGTCGTLFIKLDAKGTFTGTVAKTKGEAAINYSAQANGNTRNGTTTLHFTPIAH